MQQSKGINLDVRDTSTLLKGKIGVITADSFQSFRKDTKNFVHVRDVLNGQSKTIEKEVKDKIKNFSAIRENVLGQNVLKFMGDNYKIFEEDKSKEGVKYFDKMNSQLGAFIKLLSPSNKTDFIRRYGMLEIAEDFFEVLYDYAGEEFMKSYRQFAERERNLGH